MNIVVLIKQVPDTYSERKLKASDGILDRDATDAVLDEIDERAVEAALQLKEANGGGVTVVCMGPDRAADAIRKALSMGADNAVHLSDKGLAGSCRGPDGEGAGEGDRHRRRGGCGSGGERSLRWPHGGRASDGGGCPGLAGTDACPGDHGGRVKSHGETGDGRRRHGADRGAAHGDLGRREDQRAAVPVLQGDHGGEEEASGHAIDPRIRGSAPPR